MDHRRLAALSCALVLAGCSSGSKEPKQPTPDPTPVAAIDAAPTYPPVAESCPKLVAKFKADTSTGDTGLAPALLDKMVGVLEQHCATWEPEVVACLVDAPDDQQDACMQKLDPVRQQAFMQAIVAVMDDAAPDCQEAITAPPVESWNLTAGPVDTLDVIVLQRAVLHTQLPLCEASWSEDIRTCIKKSPSSPRGCLEPIAAIVSVSDAALAPAKKLFATAAKFKPTDKKISCAKVAAAHYGDKQWKDKQPEITGGARKAMIKGATDKLVQACTSERWTPFVRGCVVAAADETQRAWCIDARVGDFWAYPPAESSLTGTMTPTTGIPTCDEYVAAMQRFIACPTLPDDARKSMRQMLDAMLPGLSATTDPAAKTAAGDGCKAGLDALRQAASATSCPL